MDTLPSGVPRGIVPIFPDADRVFSSACLHRKKIRNLRAVLCQHESVDGGIICFITLLKLK